VHPEPDEQRDARQRQQPAYLAAELVVEQPERARLAAEPGPAAAEAPEAAPGDRPTRPPRGAARQPADWRPSAG